MNETSPNPETRIALFQRKEIRRAIHNNEWWFVVEDNLVRVADGEGLAHGSATSSSLASLPNSNSVGSNHSASVSLTLATASSCVSPAEPHP